MATKSGGWEASPLLSPSPSPESFVDLGASVNQPTALEKVYREAFFVVLPLFSGYACLFSLQHEMKSVLGLPDNNSGPSHLYGVAVSLVYIGNFVFRLGHNIIFSPFSPRIRVTIAMGSMFLSMLLLSLIVFVMAPRGPVSMVWVFIAYGLGGLGIGTFESNLLSCITPLGKRTKFWAILAIPVGVAVITIGGFIVLQLGVFCGYIYIATAVGIAAGLACFFVRMFFACGAGLRKTSVSEFIDELKHWREWFPAIKWHSLALLVDMFCVSMFAPGVILYIYDQDNIYFPWFKGSLRKDYLMAIYNSCFFVGDFFSRRIMYPRRILFPLVFWVFSAAGVVAGLSNQSELIPLCALCVSFANGCIYAQATRQIDTHVPRQYNLVAFSFWLFIGDIGSVIGSNLISYVAVYFASVYHK